MKILCTFFALINTCVCYKILGIFPYNGRSHHIFFSSLVEELALRQHQVTVINYFPLKNISNLHQISLITKGDDNKSDNINIEEYLNDDMFFFNDLFRAYNTAQVFKDIANSNCEKLATNKEIQDIIKSQTEYDLVIAEQFVSDCGLAIAHKLRAPTVGMTAHILMPWTYSRLGASNHPAFVPNHFFGSGTKPNLWSRIKSAVVNFAFNIYYRVSIQKSDHEIINQLLPDTPDLESLGRNMSLILLNQYHPLTGSRLYGANVIEVGGMHIKQETKLSDKELEQFLNSAESGVVYISFGSVASSFPRKTLNAIMNVIENFGMKFVWKVDNIKDWTLHKNVFLGKWLPQPAILCHPKVLVFITHSGMLSTSEAMHCGVPIISVPLFGDQFANAASAVENGLGVTLDIKTLNKNNLNEAIKTVLGDRYQNRANQLSKLWRDRPMSPMDTAIYWIEYVARHKGNFDMKPPTVNLLLHQYFMLDIIIVAVLIILASIYGILKMLTFFKRLGEKQNDNKKRKRN